MPQSYSDAADYLIGFIPQDATTEDEIRSELGDRFSPEVVGPDLIDEIAPQMAEKREGGDRSGPDFEGAGDYDFDPDAGMWRDNETGQFLGSGDRK